MQISRNPVGVDRSFGVTSQGSSCLATLGFAPESLWDSACKIEPPSNFMKTVIAHALLLASLIAAVARAADAPAPTNPPPATVTLHDFKLAGDLAGERAIFTLTATARVENRKGGSLELLSGAVALTELSAHPKWRIRVDQNRFVLSFDRGGEFPIQLKFRAAVGQSEGWKRVDFRVAPSALQPVVLHGLAADTQFQFAGAARPDRQGDDFVSY